MIARLLLLCQTDSATCCPFAADGHAAFHAIVFIGETAAQAGVGTTKRMRRENLPVSLLRQNCPPARHLASHRQDTREDIEQLPAP